MTCMILGKEWGRTPKPAIIVNAFLLSFGTIIHIFRDEDLNTPLVSKINQDSKTPWTVPFWPHGKFKQTRQKNKALGLEISEKRIFSKFPYLAYINQLTRGTGPFGPRDIFWTKLKEYHMINATF